jgi:hypothetical protein
MGKVQLVDQEIQEGKRIVEAIAPDGKLVAALWIFDAEAGAYYLTLALSEKSPLAAYSKVQTVLSNLQPSSKIALDDIRIVKEGDPFITELRLSDELQESQGLRLTNTSVGSFYVDDAYIYCLESIPRATKETDMVLAVKNGAWRVVPAKFIYRVGLLQEIITSAFALPMTRGRRGLNVDVFLIEKMEKRPCLPGSDCQTQGIVVQCVYRDGRLTQVIPKESNAELTARFDESGKLIA